MMTRSGDSVDIAAAGILDGRAWEALCGKILGTRRLVLDEAVPSSARHRAEGFRYLTRLLSTGINVCVELADPDYPEFGRMMDSTMKWGLDAPDCLYLYATVRGDATYRISGNRGSANYLDIQVNYGHFAAGDVSAWGTISAINGLELASEADGSFEVILSAEEHGGNWLALEPNAEFILIRQCFNDWEREQPADLMIERVGATYPAPPPTPEQMSARFARLVDWLERGGALWESMSKGFLAMEPNTLIVHRAEDSEARAGAQGQDYCMGNFYCAEDEAVLFEIDLPACQHWSVGLANWYWESLDYATRQTSLNGHQSVVDADGVFRAVIAHHDPGVANWLDTAGETSGTLIARFIMADTTPQPRMRRIPFEQIAAELPPETARIDPAARQQVLAARQRGVRRRFRR